MYNNIFNDYDNENFTKSKNKNNVMIYGNILNFKKCYNIDILNSYKESILNP